MPWYLRFPLHLISISFSIALLYPFLASLLCTDSFFVFFFLHTASVWFSLFQWHSSTYHVLSASYFSSLISVCWCLSVSVRFSLVFEVIGSSFLILCIIKRRDCLGVVIFSGKTRMIASNWMMLEAVHPVRLWHGRDEEGNQEIRFIMIGNDTDICFQKDGHFYELLLAEMWDNC